MFFFNIQTNNIIEHRRLEMIIIDKTNKKAQIVDFAVPTGHRIEISQQRKIKNIKIYNSKVKILKLFTVLIAISALGIIPQSSEKHLNELNVEVNISQMQNQSFI